MDDSSHLWNPGTCSAFLYCIAETAWGWCGLATRGAGLRRSVMCLGSAEAALEALAPPDHAVADCQHLVLRAAAAAVQMHFSGHAPRRCLPLDLEGLPAFTAAVLRACSEVPWGKVVSYGELASRAGHPGAARAAGQVMRRNPLPPFVPCHRVVGADGSLTGFGGGLELKGRLLQLEGLCVHSDAAGEHYRVG